MRQVYCHPNALRLEKEGLRLYRLVDGYTDFHCRLAGLEARSLVDDRELA